MTYQDTGKMRSLQSKKNVLGIRTALHCLTAILNARPAKF